jgi:hypothetical protein
MNHPIKGWAYTLREILEELDLDDSPSLLVALNGRCGPVQDSHLTDKQLLSVPGIAETRWEYIRTTHEWIPCFTYVGEVDVIKACIQWEPYLKFDKTDSGAWWITPVGFPRQQ